MVITLFLEVSQGVSNCRITNRCRLVTLNEKYLKCFGSTSNVHKLRNTRSIRGKSHVVGNFRCYYNNYGGRCDGGIKTLHDRDACSV